jgi:predicted nucleic acid-binding protein
MSDRFFVDTNIFVYMFDRAAPEKARHSISLIRQGLLTRKAVISFQVVQEFFSVALRRFKPLMTQAEAEQFLAMTLRPLMAVRSSYGLYAKALQLAGRNSLSWYDSLIVSAALEADCRILYTEDLQHGQQFQELRVVNPFL